MKNETAILNKRYEGVAWGAIFLLVGVLSLIPGDQNAWFVLVFGLILLGLNLARYLSQIPTNGFTIALGSVASVLGGVALLRPLLNLPRFELDLFPLVLVVIGLSMLIPGPRRTETG